MALSDPFRAGRLQAARIFKLRHVSASAGYPQTEPTRLFLTKAPPACAYRLQLRNEPAAILKLLPVASHVWAVVDGVTLVGQVEHFPDRWIATPQFGLRERGCWSPDEAVAVCVAALNCISVPRASRALSPVSPAEVRR